MRATEKNLPATQASVGVMMMIYSGDFSYDGGCDDGDNQMMIALVIMMVMIVLVMW